MSVELVDFRGRITPETDAMLEGINQITGRDRQEIAREVLHKWAVDQLEISSVAKRRLASKGLGGNDAGAAGNMRDSQGFHAPGHRGVVA